MMKVTNSPTDSVWVASWTKETGIVDNVSVRRAKPQREGEEPTVLEGEVGGRFVSGGFSHTEYTYMYVDRIGSIEDAKLCCWAADRYDAVLVPRWDNMPEEVRAWLRDAMNRPPEEDGLYYNVWRNTSPPVLVNPYSPLLDVHGDGSVLEGELRVVVAHRDSVILHFIFVQVDRDGRPLHPESEETLEGAAKVAGTVHDRMHRVEMNGRWYVVCAAPHSR